MALNQLAKMPEQIARSGEKLARESLDPKRYHRESAALKAAKSRDNSPSLPGTPKYEFDEKTPVRRRKKDKKRQEEIFITSEFRYTRATKHLNTHTYTHNSACGRYLTAPRLYSSLCACTHDVWSATSSH